MNKLKDYLHLYIGCQCGRYINGKNGEVFAKYTLTIVHHERGGFIESLDDNSGFTGWLGTDFTKGVKPILRRLESMTEEEFKGIKDELSIDINEAYNSYIRWGDKPKHVLILENRLQTNTLKFNDGIILLKMHFDLFNLIDSGQAIEKKNL